MDITKKSSFRTACCFFIIFAFVFISHVYAIELSSEEKEYLRSKGEIVFVSQTRYPPFEFTDANRQHEGMMLDVVRWMAVEMGFQPVFTNMTFQQAQEAVLSGKADILTSLFYSDKRKERFEFTETLYDVPASIFVKAERTDIKDLKDLNRKIIAIQRGDYAKDFLESEKIRFDILDTKDFAEATDMVIAGKADAVIGDEQIVLYHIFSNRLTDYIKKMDEPLYIGRNCMASNKNNAILIGILNKGINEARKSGVLYKISTKWLGSKYGPRKSFLERYLWQVAAVAGGLLLLSLLVWIWNVRLRTLVRKKTEIVTRREEALRESEEKYRTLSNNILDIIYSLDKMGNVLAVNRPAGSRYGYETEMIVGKPFLEIIHPDDREMVVNSFLQAMEDHREYTRGLQFRIQLKDGAVRWMELNSHMRFDEKGLYLQEEGVLRDITERRQFEEDKRSLEERPQRAEKMKSLGLLAGGVAHDLNNVLGIVVGYSELLLRDVDHSSSIRSKLDNIMKGGQKAAAIVQDLLTLARRGVSGRNVLNLNKIIADNQKSPEFADLFFHHSAVKIKTDLEPELLNISGSSVHLGKSLFNLVSNASEAMPKGGVLTIKTANQYLDNPIQGYDKIREGDYVILSVSDTGEGIHAADLKHIFEPFYTKKVMGRSGTGLGLAVVWGTVKDHNGYINIQSEEGKGSTFTLYFPVTREELSYEHVVVSISEYMGKGESILIVDDVKEQRDLAEEMLKKLNYSVTSASSGEKAVAYLKDHKVDLMVLDMIMDPGMDGLDTYRSVLEICLQQKAIIVSGFSETERVHAAQALGAGAYVKKPYVIEKLGLAVKKELDRAT